MAREMSIKNVRCVRYEPDSCEYLAKKVRYNENNSFDAELFFDN